MPCTDGGAPVTIERLFGFVNEGTTQSAVRQVPCSRSLAKYGALPEAIAWLMYSGSQPSTQTTTSGRVGQRYERRLTVTVGGLNGVSSTGSCGSSRPTPRAPCCCACVRGSPSRGRGERDPRPRADQRRSCRRCCGVHAWTRAA